MAIAAAFRGISSFVENGEKMFLIVGSELTADDVNAINKGILKVDEILTRKWEDCFKDFNNDIIKKRFELLSWLIANDKLEIRIGINKDESGRYLTANEAIFHEKILIFEDYDKSQIQVDGSINETWRAWRKNRESFCVHKSWVEGNDIFIKTAKAEFDKVWLSKDPTCEAVELPDAVKNRLLSITPAHKPEIEDEVDFSFEEFEEEESKTVTLRRYQLEAITAWNDNNHIGVLEMATGTGKTVTALCAIKNLPLKGRMLIIGVPQKELAAQWETQCESVFIDTPKQIIPCHSDTDWKSNLSREIRQCIRNESLGIIIAVFNTMRSAKFQDIIKNIIGDAYLILDEVHELGSFENRKMFHMFDNVKYRLGLSATPSRVWDSEGDEAIQKFFGGKPIFVWDMDKAINPPEGYERCLCPYKYHLHECSLIDDESAKYEELSNRINRKIATLMSQGKKISSIDDEPALKMLLFERANLIKECLGKDEILSDILEKKDNELLKCLVYCNDEKHMDKASSIISGKGLSCRKFFGQMDEDERERVFDSFTNSDVQFLVAIKILDQGIDLPICNSAIILSSSQNPREYVQRRGRILRLHKSKEYAIVHDIIVFPKKYADLKTGKVKLEVYEANLLKTQIKRMDIFMENSLNKAENFLKKLEYGDIITNSLKE